MANYIIEGTVLEISKEKLKNTFKIAGTEGYALIQRKGKSETRYNILCSDDKNSYRALKIEKDFSYNVSDDFMPLLISAMAHGKKVSVTFMEYTENAITKDAPVIMIINGIRYFISSVSLLAD